VTDHADAEVKGIARYSPTNLSKAILLLLPGLAWFTFSAIREHSSWFGIESWSPLEQTLMALVVSLLVCIALVIVLVLDMAFAIHHSKHRRIVHYSNEHPNMSIRFLWANATVAHWCALGVLCLIFFIGGYIFGTM
jgi:hypothetical protein